MASKSKIPKMSESNDSLVSFEISDEKENSEVKEAEAKMSESKDRSDEMENSEVKRAADWWMDEEVPSGSGGATTTLRILKEKADKQKAALEKCKKDLKDPVDWELSERRVKLQMEIHRLNGLILTLEETYLQQIKESYLLEKELMIEANNVKELRKELAQLAIDAAKATKDVNK